jgi:hypothetical protein
MLYDRESGSYLYVPRIAQPLGVQTATYAIGAGSLERYDERRAVSYPIDIHEPEGKGRC